MVNLVTYKVKQLLSLERVKVSDESIGTLILSLVIALITLRVRDGVRLFYKEKYANITGMNSENNITSALNEYLLKQQNEALFQENYERNQEEQRLYAQWQYAVNGWNSVGQLLEEANNKNKQLEIVISDLQKQIDELKRDMGQRQKTIPTRVITPGSTRVPSPAPQMEYYTDEEDLSKETEWIRVKHNTKKRRMNITPDKSIPTDEEKSKEKKKEKNPPPIMVNELKSYEELYEMLTKKLKEETFQIKLIGNTTAKINCINSDCYREMIQILNHAKVMFHTYENKQTRPIRVMAKNLHYSCKPESIKTFLMHKGFKIMSVNNKLTWKEKTPLNMFMLTFENDEDIEKIYGITHILGSKVEIANLKGTRLIPQCKKCQAFGHTQKYCARDPRCVKCAGKHITYDCQKTKNQKPKCVNCGGEHPANYRGCVVAKELQGMKNKGGTKTKPNNKSTEETVQNVQKKNENKNKQEKVTYASTAASEAKTTIQEENGDKTLQLILTKITKMENSFIEVNKKIKEIEGSIKNTTSSKAQKNINKK